MNKDNKLISESYSASNGKIKAELHLTATPDVCDVYWYTADFNFYTDPVFSDNEKGFSIETHYTNNNFEDIFNRLKAAEKGLERVLASPRDYNKDLTCATDVFSCILDLEKQALPVYEKILESYE